MRPSVVSSPVRLTAWLLGCRVVLVSVNVHTYVNRKTALCPIDVCMCVCMYLYILLPW